MLRRVFGRRPSAPAPVYDLSEVQASAASGRKLAIYDRVTGLYAYWYLELRSDEEISRSRRYDKPLSCLSVWSPAPDLVTETAARLRERLREHDLAAYLNNGHFVILLAETDGAGAEIVAQRIRAAAGPGALCGVAAYPADGESFEEPLESAKRNASELAA